MLEGERCRHDPVRHLLGRQPRRGGEHLGDPRFSEERVAFVGLGHPVGVEHDRVPRVQDGRGLAYAGRLLHAKEAPGTPERLNAAVGAAAERKRVAPGGHRQAVAFLGLVKQQVQHRDEGLRVIGEQGLMQARKHRGGRGDVQRLGPDGVAGQCRHNRGRCALAAHIAKHDAPRLVAGTENVVEVAADLGAVPGRTVGAAHVQAGHGDDVGRQERALQGLGQDPGTRLGLLGPAPGGHQLALVGQALAGIERDRPDDQGLTVITPLKLRVHDHGQARARGANHLDGDFPEHALHQQHRGRVGLVEDAVTGGEQVLETAPAYEGVPVIAGPGQEGGVGLDDGSIGQGRQVAAWRVVVQLSRVVLGQGRVERGRGQVMGHEDCAERLGEGARSGSPRWRSRSRRERTGSGNGRWPSA